MMSDRMTAWRAQNPGAASYNSKKAWRDHPESFIRSEDTNIKISVSASKYWNQPHVQLHSSIRMKMFWAANTNKLAAMIKEKK